MLIDTTQGVANIEAPCYGVPGEKINLYQYVGDNYCLLFSHPSDYTPVCTTELSELAKLKGAFERRGCKLVGLSCDDLQSHRGWAKDVASYSNTEGKELYPIICDPDRKIVEKLGFYFPHETTESGAKMSSRACVVIDRQRKIKTVIMYPMTTGRNFDEILRVVDSLMMTEKYPVATPANWKPGYPVLASPDLSDSQVKTQFKSVTTCSMPSKKNYMRFVHDSLTSVN